ncbi:MAG TPA: ATP-binding protein [Anaerolineales bacterium]|nr:ATP-binding protein [Anaerolineales bacterium]
MRRFLNRILLRFQRMNLSQRLILNLVLVVVAIIVFIGIPTNLAMWRALENQVWLRVQDAQSATNGLYNAEVTRLKKLSGLIAGRPTLYNLIQQGDVAGMKPYLNALKEESGDLGVVQVITPDFQAGDELSGFPTPADFLAGNEPYYANFVIIGDPGQLYVVGVSQIQSSAQGNPLLGYVVVARAIQSDYMKTLEEETGLAQSLIVSGRRVATSLPAAPDWSLDPQSALKVEKTGQACCTMASAMDQTYYVGLMPISDSHGNILALSEVALPGSSIRQGMINTILISAGFSILLMLIGSYLVARQARSITHPLLQLSKAADQISQGNLDVSTPNESGIQEINQLSQHFESARRQLRRTLSVTQREMKHAERLLSLLPKGVIALDENDRITFFNPDAEEILGYKSGDVERLHYTHIFPPAPGETLTVGELLQKPADGPVAQRVNVLDAHGKPLLLYVAISPPDINPPTGYGSERVVVIRDVTEEEAVNRLRYNFLANVAHEFRTPLSGIAATSEILVEEGTMLTPNELRGVVETIQLSTLHLQTLVENLLESTTIEAGCFQVHRRPIHLDGVVQDAANLMTPLFKRRKQKLVLSVPEKLPTLWADANRLIQVLVNLLSNASKFSPMNGKIELRVAQDSELVTISVIDSGPGLPTNRFADLFKRFVTASQSHDTQYGIGLGLSVVKSIVEMHGGQVGAENLPTGGAKVWFTIPIHPPEEKENL